MKVEFKKRLVSLLDRKFPVKNEKKKISRGRITKNADLFRETFTISSWSDAVDEAEDVDQPDRIELARLYKNVIDDESVFSGMQIRTSKSIKGKMEIQDKDGNPIESIESVFFKPDGNSRQWFREWMKLQIKAKFYGAVLMNFGDIKNGRFSGVEMVDYQNVIPEKNKLIVNTDYGLWGNSANLIDFSKRPLSTWCYLVDDGDSRSLGLLNKCAPYYIWKNDSLGNWSMFQDIFGVDTKVGKTDTTDKVRREDMDDALSNTQGADSIVIHTDDEIEFVSSSQGDAYNTYEKPNLYYDKAIAKILMGQASLAEEKSFVGSAEIQASAFEDIIMFDKFDISDNFEEQLVPFMQMHGLIPEGEYYLIWDLQEKLSMQDMADVIDKLSKHYNVDPEVIEKRFGFSVDKKESNPDIIEQASNAYKEVLNGKATK